MLGAHHSDLFFVLDWGKRRKLSATRMASSHGYRTVTCAESNMKARLLRDSSLGYTALNCFPLWLHNWSVFSSSFRSSSSCRNPYTIIAIVKSQDSPCFSEAALHLMVITPPPCLLRTCTSTSLPDFVMNSSIQRCNRYSVFHCKALCAMTYYYQTMALAGGYKAVGLINQHGSGLQRMGRHIARSVHACCTGIHPLFCFSRLSSTEGSRLMDRQ